MCSSSPNGVVGVARVRSPIHAYSASTAVSASASPSMATAIATSRSGGCGRGSGRRDRSGRRGHRCRCQESNVVVVEAADDEHAARTTDTITTGDIRRSAGLMSPLRLRRGTGSQNQVTGVSRRAANRQRC